MTVPEICRLLAKYRFSYSTEKELQDKIEDIFKKENVIYLREVRLTSKDIIDFKIGNIGIEVKIKGTQTNLIRQVHRYSERPEIGAILVVTDKSGLSALPDSFNDTDISVYRIYNF